MPGCRPFTAEEEGAIVASFVGRYASRNRAMFALGCRSGFRISELLSVRLGQVVEDGKLVRAVTVRRVAMKGGSPGRPGRGRAVLLTQLRAFVQAFGLQANLEDERAWRRFETARRRRKSSASSRSILLHPEAARALREWIRQLRELGYMTGDSFVFQSAKAGNSAIARSQAYRLLIAACRRARISTARVGTHSMRKTFAERMRRRLGSDLRKLQEAMGHASVTSTAQYVEINRGEIDEAILNA